MAEVPGMKIEIGELSQELDLSEYVGKDISANENLVKKIGQGILDYMIERVAEYKGQNRTNLHKPYSKSYINSSAFKAAGKSKNAINMKLSGDMLRSMDIISIDGSVIKYGIAEDTLESTKGFAHYTGFEGHPTIKGVPARKWFGITTEEFKNHIMPKFSDEISSSRKIGDILKSGSTENNAVSTINKIRKIGDLLEIDNEN